MAEEKRTYSKGNPERALLSQQKTKTVDVASVPLADIQIPSESYQKMDKEKLPKTFYIIISGGEKREKDYFKILLIHDKFNRIRLDCVSDPLKLSPDGMYELAEYKKTHYLTSRNEDAEPDMIYLVSDVDHFMSELIRIKPKCEKEGFKLIISNSCFEVWLYYACLDVIPNFPIPDDPLRISSKFKGWINSAILGGAKPNKAIFNIYDNIKNARKNYAEDTNGIPSLFSTNMFLLAEDLLPLIEPELSTMIATNKKKEVEFRKKRR